MGDKSRIEWTNTTWNPVVGCSVISPGCTNCYAMREAHRLAARLRVKKYAGLTIDSKAGPVWNGTVRLAPEQLDAPLHWREPRRIFVNSMSDLFHEALSDEAIDRVFAIMALTPRHTFQVLTKRAERMRAYFARPLSRQLRWWNTLVERHPCGRSGPLCDFLEVPPALPMPNVWLGVSAEDQRRADQRIPDLLETPAAVRFVSAEPLLGLLDLRRLCYGVDTEALPAEMARGVAVWHDGLAGGLWSAEIGLDGVERGLELGALTDRQRLDWVIVGGESGPRARPVNVEWVRQLRDQCTAAGVPFFFKQWGEWLPGAVYAVADQGGFVRHQDGSKHAHGGKPDHWWGGDTFGGNLSTRVGKKAAGRQLDGREWSEFPKPQRVPA